MIRILIFLVFLAAYASCADHNLFKNCSRIPFCNSLRDSKPKSQLTAQLKQLSQNKNIISIPLSNTDKQEFDLQVTILTNKTARIKILDKKNPRYELVDVLDKEPTQLEITSDSSKEGTVTIKPTDSSYSHKIVLTADPLKIEFYYDDEKLQSVFRGESLIFDTESKSFAFGVEFVDAVRLYGLHHHATDLKLPGTKANKIDPFRLRNSDNANYEVGSPMALYGAVPAVYGHSEKSTSGIFLHNAAEQWIDVSYDKSSFVYFMVDRATLDLFVFLGNTPKDVVRQFVEITGVAHMPQLWTLGYHQCRWSYLTQEDAKDVVAQMDSHDMPMDALWLDIDYTDGFRYFTWNPVNYSDPMEFQANLSSTNRKLVTILDPHIKIDKNYPVYTGAKGKYFVKTEDGDKDFEGSCWPGVSSYIDFLNPEARDYYASWYSYEKFKGSTPTLAGVWNDMNEPSVFDDSTEKTMPFEALHHGDVRHGDIHNIYGFLQTKATHQGLMQRDNGQKRPFILTRSTFAGSQRYAAMWTGDNTADWPYLQVSYSECILSNLVGLAFCGADVGGFFNDPEVELVERWYQAGIWLPFYRGHAEKTTKRREPYLFDSTVQGIIRSALMTRYQHIPVWYTLFYEHTRTGDPVVRPLFYEYPGTVDRYNHILIGSDILARPVMEKGVKNINVTFPGDDSTYWYRVDDNSFKPYEGGNTVTLPVNITTSPYFYKGGSIIARKDINRQSTTDMLNDPYSLYINLDKNEEATGTIYVDDFISFDYKHKELYCYLEVKYIPETGGIHIKQIDGNATNFNVELSHIYVHQYSTKEKKERRVITNLADGTSLKNIKIVSKLDENKKLFLQL